MVRTRVAPSPTGDPHVGTAYMALFNYCFAKANGGQFLLRIEDTDQKRSTALSEQNILKALHWLGLSWDEGPDVGGPHGPYRQSERMDIYKRYADQLLAEKKAFYCFCSADRLKNLRKEQVKRGTFLGYDGHCLGLSDEEIKRNLDEGREHVLRLNVPRSGFCRFKDYLRNEVKIAWSEVDMQVLMKSDGMPTYHLASVVDDHEMEITHVIRGEEWLPSTPKHLLLYQYFGWEAPVFCHMPLLRNPDHSKLSKRKNPTSILWYQRMGYLPEALLNYLGTMSWSMPHGEDKFTLDDMIGSFDLARVSPGGPIFDMTKLTWLNGRWIRENLDLEGFSKRVYDWAVNPDYMKSIAELAQPRVSRLSDLGPLVSFMFAGRMEYSADLLTDQNVFEDTARKAFYLALNLFEKTELWDKPSIEAIIRKVVEITGIKLKFLVRPFYVAVSGSPASLPLFDSMALLGRDICRDRIRYAVELLGGNSQEEIDEWNILLEDREEADEETL